MLLVKIALKNLRGNLSFTLFFILNLSIGLIGYTMLDGFKSSFKSSVEGSSKEMATADLKISARKVFAPGEITAVNDNLAPYIKDKSQVTIMYSMAAYKASSRLVELKAVEPNYPMYGKMTFNEDLKYSIQDGYYAYVYTELLEQLGAKLGDSLAIGSKSFEIVGTIDEDAGTAWAGASVAPRVYISRTNIENLDLIQKGSSVWTHLLYKLKNDQISDEAKKIAKETLPGKGVNVQTHLEAGQQSGRLIGYLNDYLGLVSLAAFFLAAIGAAFLYRSYLNSKLADTATLITLGISPLGAFAASIMEILMLSLSSALLSTFFSAGLLPVLTTLVGDFLPVSVDVSIGLKSIAASFLLATLGSLTVCLPLISSSRHIKPAILFQEARHETITLSLKDRIYFFTRYPSFLAHRMLAGKFFYCWFCFFALFLLGSVLLYIAGLIALRLLGKIASNFSFSVKSAFLYMSRQKFASITCFLALALGTMLTSLIPSLRASLYSELESPDGKTIPSLFLFDIQSEQEKGLKDLLEERGTPSSLLSPMIRAQLLKVNGKEFKKREKTSEYETREEERDRAFTNRTMNLTYRDKADSSETIVEGEFWDSPWDPSSGKLPEISIEQRFAGRLDLKMNDILEFEVLGVPVKGQITSVRKIRWTTFQPNFFLQFQPGVLEYAPKTFVGAINKIEEPKRKAELQASIVSKYPNISLIDVSRLVKRITEIIDKMSWALTFMAILCLLAGFIVLYSICRQQVNARIWDITMYKILGASFPMIKKSIVTEFLTIAFLASLFGTAISLAASFILSKFVFEGVYVFDPTIPALMIVSVTVLGIIVASRTASNVLKGKSASFL